MSKATRSRLSDALDERTGFRRILRFLLHHRVPGGARTAYVFGSALLFTFGIQVITGITLATVYSPSVTDAWGSVYYIQNHMTLGWLVRGIHHFGSSAMIVLCVLHMTQVLWFGAYRAPREGNWLTGVAMLLVVLGFGLTGYLLPWDQKGYWATQVATSIMGGTPGGGVLQALLQGGAEYGNATLTRFYGLHVFVLPATLGLFLVLHLGLFFRHNVTPPPRLSDAEVDRKAQPFHPYQVLLDLLFALIVIAVLVALTVAVGVSLEAPADPAGAYEARPEWYFLFLFQLLKYFEGPMVLVGTVILPTLALIFLFAVPFLDRRQDRSRARPSLKVLVPYVAMMLGVGVLTLLAVFNDSSSESFQEGRAKADAEATRAAELAELGGIDAQGRVVLFSAEKLFHSAGCSSCHAKDADTPAPLLAGYGSAERLTDFLRDPNSDRFFGRTFFKGEMDAFSSYGTDADLPKVVAYLTASDAPAEVVAAGKAFFEDNCTDCHNGPDVRRGHADYTEAQAGPDLADFQTFEWVRALVRDAGHPDFFGGSITKDQVDDAMPNNRDLSDDELGLLVTWLLAGAPGAD